MSFVYALLNLFFNFKNSKKLCTWLCKLIDKLLFLNLYIQTNILAQKAINVTSMLINVYDSFREL